MADTLIEGYPEPNESLDLDEFLTANYLRLQYESWYDQTDEIPSENYRDKSLGIDHLDSYGTLFGATHGAIDLSTACLPSDIEIEWQRPCSSLIMELPMWLKGKVVYCKPDSGSDENVMSLELAISLGLTIVCEQRYQRDFTLGNGKTVRAIGCVDIYNGSFVKDSCKLTVCQFYVLQSLIFPAVMGMSFLEQTATLSKHRYRLQKRQRQGPKAFHCGSIDYPRKRLGCLVNGHAELVNADTGSELNLMSWNYVRKRGFILEDLEPDTPNIQFADGSTISLGGRVHVDVVLDVNVSVKTTFYVLGELICDILLGEGFLTAQEIFERFEPSMVLCDGQNTLTELNPIVWLNRLEQGISRFFGNDCHKLEREAGQTSFILFKCRNVITYSHLFRASKT